MEHVAYEVCVESVSDACAAERGGAARVELCANLAQGGTTASLALTEAVRAAVRIPVVLLVRPRAGDFVYDDMDVGLMERVIRAAKSARVDGVAIGVLRPDGAVDDTRMAALVAAARPLAVTFHRAFDCVRDPFEALETICALGIERILSSGARPSALEGRVLLRELVENAGDRVTLVAAGGVRPHNVARIVAATGVREIHGSAHGAGGPTDEAVVRGVLAALAAS